MTGQWCKKPETWRVSFTSTRCEVHTQVSGALYIIREPGINLFILDLDVERNVQYHVDDHVNKIALECCQVLSTALWLRNEPGVSYDASIWYQRGLWNAHARQSVHRAYTPTHFGPLANWCIQPANYMWALRYGIELCKEHQYRKGTVIQQWRMLSQLPRFTVYESPSVWYAAVTDDLLTANQLKVGKLLPTVDIVEVYRRYYRRDKVHLHQWTKRGEPEWLNLDLQ